MLVSRSVKTKGIFSFAELVAVVAVVALAGHVMNFYVVSHIGWLLACVVTITALPQPFLIFPHLVSHFSIYTSNFVIK